MNVLWDASTAPTTRPPGYIRANPDVQPGYTLGDPTFDYNDGQTANQGMVVGDTRGFLHWIPLSYLH